MNIPRTQRLATGFCTHRSALSIFHNTSIKARVQHTRLLSMASSIQSRRDYSPLGLGAACFPAQNTALSTLRHHDTSISTYRSPMTRRQFSFEAGSDSIMSVYWIMLGLNAVPFALWSYAEAQRNSSLQHWLAKNFLISAESWERGRWWTVVTSAFSHASLGHFAFNMFTAHTMCKMLSFVPGLGPLQVASIILGSAVSGSIGFIVTQKARMQQNKGGMQEIQAYHQPALGASGAVMGLAAVATGFFPFASMNIMFIPIAIPLWGITAAYFAIDAFRLNSPNSRVAHAGHLGGLAFGSIYYLAALKGLAPFGLWHVIRRYFRL